MIRLAKQVSVAAALILGLLALVVLAFQFKRGSARKAQDQVESSRNDVQPSKESTPKPGLSLNDPRAFQGYTLIAPLQSTNTYLIDMQGRVVRTWKSNYAAGQDAYLLENGHLLRPGKLSSKEQLFTAAGDGGRVQEFTSDGELVWDFKFHNDKQLPHHDIARLPNGNVLLMVWEMKTAEETIAAGRRPESESGPCLADSIIEIKPTGKTTGEVTWEWHAWDHLIQDHDSSKANYGDVAAHPELIDVNFDQDLIPKLFPLIAPSPNKQGLNGKALDKLRSIGYLGSSTGKANQGVIPDWTHFNSVAYNADLDQIMVSSRGFNEFWIIDHGTTSAEAAGHTGGRSGKGGDLLYRWGNPQAYRAGTGADQRLFSQHDAHWIPRGRPGGGHVLVFNNGAGRSVGSYSSVDELVLPVDAEGRYSRKSRTAYGPDSTIWSYTARKKKDFLAWLMGGAQRLPNGDTLICESMSGTIFEVTSEKEVVWKYTYAGQGRSGPGRFGPSPGGFPVVGLGSSVFRAYRYAPNYPGLVGKDLTPGKTVE